MQIRTTPRANTQINQIDEWWLQNRTAAPSLFLDEFHDCIALLRQSPRAGTEYWHYKVQGVRRVLLQRSGYHVYYVVGDDEIRIVAVWHAKRGSGPPLR